MRAAATNLGWLVVERVARLVFNVVVGFAVARYLGPAQFGALSYALALVAIGGAVAECGLANVVKRALVADPSRAAATLAAAWKLRLLAGATCYGAVLLWTLGGERDGMVQVLLVILGLLLFQPALAVSELWLHARLEARLVVRAQIAALIIGAAMRLGLIWARAPLWAFAAVAVLEAAVAVAVLNGLARAHGRPTLHAAPVAALPALWHDAWPLLLSGLTVMLYIRLDLVMVRQMLGEAAAGEYAAAVRLSELGFFVPGAVASSALPQLLHARAVGQRSYFTAMQRFIDLNTGIAYLLVVPIVLLAPWLVKLAYGGDYAAAAPVLVVHAWTLVWAASGVARGQYCINEGLTRLHLQATAAGALINLGLNLLLIPRYGIVGAAWATVAAQVVAAWFSSFWFAATRECARMQTLALLLPVRWIFHVRSSR